MNRSFISIAVLISGGILVTFVVLSGFVSVITWQADLYATEDNVESADIVTANALPGECSRFAQSLASSQNVTIREYRIGIDSIDVLVRYTPEEGWMFGDTNCSSRLAFHNNLQISEQAYNIEGHYTKTTLHNKPVFRSGQLLGGLFGFGMLFVGYRIIQSPNSE